MSPFAVLLILALAAPQQAPGALPASSATADRTAPPFDWPDGVDTAEVEFWCAFESTGYPDCEAVAMDPVELRIDAGDWLESAMPARPDYAAAGLKRRYVFRWERGAIGVRGLGAAASRFAFVGARLDDPPWEIGPADVDPAVVFGHLTAAARAELAGAVSLMCGVRDDGYLGLCVGDGAPREGIEGRRLALAQVLAANLKVASMTGGGEPTAGRHVRLDLNLDPSSLTDKEVEHVLPRVVWQRPQTDLGALYPPAALRAGQDAVVTYECVSPAVEGPLENCVMLHDSNPRWGFGPAAFAVAGQTITSPLVVDGRPVRFIVRQAIQWSASD